MGEAGTETGGIEHISQTLLERERAAKDAIERGDAEIEIGRFPPSALGLGDVVCDHWGRMYWHRFELDKLVKIYDPTETRTNRVDTAVVKQLNKSMDLNRNMKTAIRALQSNLNGPDSEALNKAEAILELDKILRMS